MRKYSERFFCKGSRFETFEGYEFNQENWEELIIKGVLPKTEISLANDWVITYRPNYWKEKYNKFMYSKTLDKLRCVTFDEFYGNGIVD